MMKTDVRFRSIGLLTTCVGVLAIAQPAQCGLIVLDVNATSVDVGGDGDTDFDFNIDVVDEADTFRTVDVNAMHLAPGGSFPDSALRSWRLTDAVTSGPTPSTPVAGTAFYTDLDASIVSTTNPPVLNSGFQAGDDNFVGISFKDNNINGGNTVYGFAQIFADDPSSDGHSIVRIIYEDMGNAITLSGDVSGALGGPSNTPEPSTFALFGLGCLGFGTLRRRRNRAA